MIDDLIEAQKTIEDCNFYLIDVDLDCRSYSERLMDFTQRISFGKKFYKDDYNGELIKTRLNYLQDYLSEYNRALYTYEKRDTFGTALAALTSPEFIDVQVLEEAATGAVKQLAYLLFDIGSEILYFKPEEKNFVNIYNHYEDYYQNKSSFNNARTIYVKKKEEKYIDNDSDELSELRTSFFVELVQSGFFLKHYDDMTASATNKVKDEVDFCFVGKEAEELHLDKCYALFRKMVGYDGERYKVCSQKVGKYLYDNRKELNGFHIDALFLYIGLLGEVQKDMFAHKENDETGKEQESVDDKPTLEFYKKNDKGVFNKCDWFVVNKVKTLIDVYYTHGDWASLGNVEYTVRGWMKNDSKHNLFINQLISWKLFTLDADEIQRAAKGVSDRRRTINKMDNPEKDDTLAKMKEALSE